MLEIGIKHDIIPSFEQGTISTNGSNSSSATRVRISQQNAIIPKNIIPNILIITVPSGLKINWREYQDQPRKETYTRGGSDWQTDNFIINIIPNYYYRLIAADINDSDITPDDVRLSDIKITYMSYTDDTLTQQYIPAEAQAVGNAIDALNTNLTNLNSDLLSKNEEIWDLFYPYPIDHFSFAQGLINIKSGNNQASSNRIRTSSYITFREYKKIIIIIPEELKISFRIYDNNKNYIESLASDWIESNEYIFSPNSEYFYRFVISYINDSEITPDNNLLSNLTFLGIKNFNDFQKIKIAKNTLLGNVSIRAAKTINFNDGTDPHIDWYLIQDINNNFYKTKDFIIKEFLFTFNAPTGSVADWSSGIDANNNIFFLKDAAGYTAEDGPRLDDEKRENPVYYLSSENYVLQHTLDFGSRIKPAGWLSNVGWCVLPNNDIVMCEYTRGTLATCNVWHVNATDTTDITNWTVTWSHEIIDTIDVTTPGIKHCHTIQYDFYTNIVYFSTGDSETGSFIYYSTDNGNTWTLAYGPNKKKCRQISFCFTEDKVYWASDSYEEVDRYFFIATRKEETNIIDIENARQIQLGAINRQSCYGVVRIYDPNLIVLMERNDAGLFSTLTMHAYDIDTDSIVELGVLNTIDGTRLGFRCKYIEWYPKGNMIRCGFNPSSESGTPDTNTIKVCGNQGGRTGNGSNRINNLKLYIYKNATNYNVKFDTNYC